MKMNKWTMGLAAAGIVSLSSVAQAQDAAAGAEALAASTTLSGYVSTGYKFGSGNASTGYFRAGENVDSFSLDVVDLKLSSAQGDGAMDTGYTVELWMGSCASIHSTPLAVWVSRTRSSAPSNHLNCSGEAPTGPYRTDTSFSTTTAHG